MTSPQPTVLVTGASGGIGSGIAEHLAASGWRLALHTHAQYDHAAALRDRIRAAGGTAACYTADLANEDEVATLFSEIDAGFGGLDAVVSNAGIFPRSSVLTMSLVEWDHVIAVNLRSTFLVCRAAVQQFVARGVRGRIVTIASGSAQRGMPRGAHYAASKAAIVAFTKSLALEMAPHQILVNCVSPGTIDTSMPRGGATETELLEYTRSRVPLGRMGRPSDVAEVVGFLLSERLSWMTGQTLWVNGGDLMP